MNRECHLCAFLFVFLESMIEFDLRILHKENCLIHLFRINQWYHSTKFSFGAFVHGFVSMAMGNGAANFFFVQNQQVTPIISIYDRSLL